MKINWKIRFGNEVFWMSAIPALALVVTSFAEILGFTLDLGELANKILMFIKAVFAFLAVLGIVVDPTTAGVNDSERALSYKEPWQDVTLEDDE